MNEQIYQKLLEEVTLVHNDLKAQAEAGPEPFRLSAPATTPDPEKTLATAKQGIADLHAYVIDRLRGVVTTAQSAEQSVELAHSLVDEHCDRYIKIASAALETASALEKTIAELMSQATKSK